MSELFLDHFPSRSICDRGVHSLARYRGGSSSMCHIEAFYATITQEELFLGIIHSKSNEHIFYCETINGRILPMKPLIVSHRNSQLDFEPEISLTSRSAGQSTIISPKVYNLFLELCCCLTRAGFPLRCWSKLARMGKKSCAVFQSVYRHMHLDVLHASLHVLEYPK